MKTEKIFVAMAGMAMLPAILVTLPADVAKAVGWSTLSSLTTSRDSLRATLLPNVKGLVTAGVSNLVGQ